MRATGDLIQTASAESPPVTTLDIPIPVSVRIGTVCDCFLICRMVGSSPVEQGFVRVAPEIAEDRSQAVRPIVEAFHKPHSLPDFLKHLTEEMRQSLGAVQLGSHDLQVDLPGNLRQT